VLLLARLGSVLGTYIGQLRKNYSMIGTLVALGMITFPWFQKFETERHLGALPIVIATSLHQMAEKDDPQVAPEALLLPKVVHNRFREKVCLYREANILLALLNRIKPSRDGGFGDRWFKPVFLEYGRIIYGQSTRLPNGTAKRQSVRAAIKDLNAHLHPHMGNRYDLAREWSSNWFADIGYQEMNPEILARFSVFLFDEYSAVQKALEADCCVLGNGEAATS
jgi:hypothetical protein